MHEYLILFAYHRKNDGLTWKHYALMQHFNPGIPIVPLTAGNSTELPNTIDVSQFPTRWDTIDQWAGADTMIYRWFENRKTSAKRYVYTEYDMLCQMSFPEFLKEVWDCPLASRRYFTFKSWSQWEWARWSYDLLPDDSKPYAAACCPLGLLLFSHDALEKIAANAGPHKVFSEVRLGTTTNKLGIPVTEIDKAKHIITWEEKKIIKRNEPAIYHPVKTMDFV